MEVIFTVFQNFLLP